jgi:hypothetical protein
MMLISLRRPVSNQALLLVYFGSFLPLPGNLFSPVFAFFLQLVIKNNRFGAQCQTIGQHAEFTPTHPPFDSHISILIVFSTLNLLGIYHDTILTKHVASLPATHRPTPSPLNRYTRDWQNSSLTYSRIAMLLTVIQYTEVLIEMGVQKKWGQQYKWRVITALEAIK